MKWLTWDQAALIVVASTALGLILRKLPPSSRRRFATEFSFELARVSFLYMLWRLAMKLPLDQPAGAIERARSIVAFQQFLRIPDELSVQHFVLHFDRLAKITNFYYAVFHVPATIVFLVWLFIRHRDSYPHWRNGLALLTAACLVIRYIRVAPPRFLPELGYVDLATRYGLSVYGPVGTGVSDQFAAMPSIHVGWAAVVSLGIISVSSSKWRWAYGLHLMFTVFAVAATGNHWWADSAAAILLLLIALWIDTSVRNYSGNT
ncbi:MAG: inositol phosphorylceramide synthase [Actinobacteria bacterium]|nr:inositol phosphorylceramide synthase [Actinomycetota bacterium]